MEAYRKTRQNMGPNSVNSVDTYSGSTGGAQGLATLVTMIAVLVIILLFCFWSAPGIRDFCRRNICCICPISEPVPRELSSSLDNSHHYSPSSHGVPMYNDNSNTMPTIVLLPFGRMLVVDRSIFAQMEADDTGLDFLELSANVIRAHHNYLMQHDPEYMRNQSDDTLSKGDLTALSSQLSVEHRPPAYEDIFGAYCKTTGGGELPPSYSEANLLLRQLVRTGSLNVLHPIFTQRQRSFSTRTMNDTSSILIRYESEGSSRRFLRQAASHHQQSRSVSLDEEVINSVEVNLSDNLEENISPAGEQDHVVLVIGEADDHL